MSLGITEMAVDLRLALTPAWPLSGAQTVLGGGWD